MHANTNNQYTCLGFMITIASLDLHFSQLLSLTGLPLLCVRLKVLGVAIAIAGTNVCDKCNLPVEQGGCKCDSNCNCLSGTCLNGGTPSPTGVCCAYIPSTSGSLVLVCNQPNLVRHPSHYGVQACVNAHA